MGKRFIYWIKVRLGRLDKRCKCFCVICPFYTECKEDMGNDYVDKKIIRIL